MNIKNADMTAVSPRKGAHSVESRTSGHKAAKRLVTIAPESKERPPISCIKSGGGTRRAFVATALTATRCKAKRFASVAR